jgi:excisionase family DNA binding protein
MTESGEPAPLSRYMTQAEAAHELRCSPATIRNLITDGLLDGVKLNHRKNAAVRIPRASFAAYCERIEREAAQRYDIPA